MTPKPQNPKTPKPLIVGLQIIFCKNERR